MLRGIRVLELVGIGPGPFAAMLLADLGADVVSLRRPGSAAIGPGGLDRGRPVLEVDLKDESRRGAARRLAARADVLIEGFRPGVAERLGLGPQECLTVNPGLVYARITGWGQSGPRASEAGHDLTYIAVSGALHLAARAGAAPTPPANLLGDFGGGGMYLVTMVLAALLERMRSGRGQVLDVAIVDGTAYLTSMAHAMRAQGLWSDTAGTNLLDTGAPYYDVYPCADGRYVAVAALEAEFFAALVELLGLDPQVRRTRNDPATWPALRTAISAAVASRTRDDWATRAAGTDACLAPVLDLGEARTDPVLVAHGVFPTPAARPGRHATDPADAPAADPAETMPRLPAAHTRGERRDPDPAAALRRWGLDEPVARLLLPDQGPVGRA